MPELAVEIKSILPWEVAVRVADAFQAGRIFLAGDAAHQMPPWGGMGANSGIADVHNLTWKLAAVFNGHATTDLLATYDIERRPVGLAAAVSAGNLSGKDGVPTMDKLAVLFGQVRTQDNLSAMFVQMMGFNYQYTSAAIISERGASSVGAAVPVDGRLGTRAPHAWVEHQGKRISTLDLFGRNFVLLTGSEGAAWCEAARAIAARSGLNLMAYQIGPDGDLVDPQNTWQAKAGIEADGAVLVRPDGFVAWRSQSGVPQPEQELEQIMSQMLGYVPRV